MEQGIYGFPPGKNITVDDQLFEMSGTWYKPNNAKLCFILGSGGGQAGSDSSGAGVVGGAAGSGYEIWLNPSRLNPSETVTIGAGGASAGAEGGNTTFAGYLWMGARGTSAARNPWVGLSLTSTFGSSGAANVAGRCGGHGAGGGGGGGASAGAGRSGGRPRSYQFTSAAQTALDGGGAPNTTTGNGTDARPEFDVDGYGEGAASGGGSSGNGGRGRRGSGGGGGGATAGLGGAGGDGFIRIITYCWE